MSGQYLFPTSTYGELSPFPPEGLTLGFDPAWSMTRPLKAPPPAPDIIVIGSTIRGNGDLFHAKTTNGNAVIYWKSECVCVILYNGVAFLRMSLLQNYGLQHQIKGRATDIRSHFGWAQTDFADCDDYNWAGALKWANGLRPPSPVQGTVSDGILQEP